MSSLPIRYLNLLLILCVIASCTPRDKYRGVIHTELEKLKIDIDEHKDVLVFVYNKSECSNCNITMSFADGYEPLLSKIPVVNRCIVTTPVREIEKNEYSEHFSFLNPKLPIIYNRELFEYFSKAINAGSYEGGIIILDKSGKIVLTSKMKNSGIMADLNNYLQAR